eukprot:tig00021257_g19768.t1
MAVAPLAHGVLRQAHVIQAALQVAGEGAAAGQEDHAPAPLEGWLQMTSTWAAPGSSGPNVECGVRPVDSSAIRSDGRATSSATGWDGLISEAQEPIEVRERSLGVARQAQRGVGRLLAGEELLAPQSRASPPSCGALRPLRHPCADPCVGPAGRRLLCRPPELQAARCPSSQVAKAQASGLCRT